MTYIFRFAWNKVYSQGQEKDSTDFIFQVESGDTSMEMQSGHKMPPSAEEMLAIENRQEKRTFALSMRPSVY